MKAIVLLSGGLDSAACLALALQERREVTALYVVYGQRHYREGVSAERLAAHYDVPLRKVSVRGMPEVALTQSGAELAQHNDGASPAHVPGRNSILLSFALSHAEAIGADEVWIGACRDDQPGFIDCRPGFFRAWQTTANVSVGTNRRVCIRTPLAARPKGGRGGVGKLAESLGVPVDLTWSCYTPKLPHGVGYSMNNLEQCGECDACKARARALA